MLKKNDLLRKAQSVAEKTINTAKEQLDKAEGYLDSKKEIIKLKFAISCKEAELETLYADYGKACYHGRADKEEIEKAIDCSIDEIDELKDELPESEIEDDTAGVVYCSVCGKQYPADANYCTKCGHQLM